jgi:antirestriction protein ArdC
MLHFDPCFLIFFPDVRRARIRSKERGRLIHRVYTVFNAKQIEGIPAHTPKRREEFEIVNAGESIIKNSGAKSATIRMTARFITAKQTASICRQGMHLERRQIITAPPSMNSDIGLATRHV